MSHIGDRQSHITCIPMEKTTACNYQLHSEMYKQLPGSTDGKEDHLALLGKVPYQEHYVLDEVGFDFVRSCIEAIESHGLEDEGLYRLVGVSSKVNKLTQTALDKHKKRKMNLSDETEWEVKTITSALKNYFRNLDEPLLTFKLHSAFIAAAKQENKVKKVVDIHFLVHQLPRPNFKMLELLTRHLCRVAKHCSKNLMTVSNLGVCFGPTLLRQQEETVAAILDIKFGNIVVEILIEHCDRIFETKPSEHECKKRPVSSPVLSYSTLTLSHRHSAGLEGESPILQRKTNRETTSFTETNKISSNTAQIPHQKVVRTSRSGTITDGSDKPNALTQKSYGAYTHSAKLSFHSHHITVSPLRGSEKEPQDSHLNMHPSGHSQPLKETALTVYSPSWNDSCLHSNGGSSESINSQLSPSTANPMPLVPCHSISASPETSPRRKPLSKIACEPNLSSSIVQTIRNPDIRIEHGETYEIGYCNSISDYQNCIDTSGAEAMIQYQSSHCLPSGRTGKRVRTLYSCIGENESELSFEPNQVIYNVRPSKEPGWLEGYLNGHTGLLPENYVEYLP